mgnify:FL=1
MQTKPQNLLDELKRMLGLKTDAQLAEALKTPPPVISKVRTGALLVGSTMLIRMYDASGLSIDDLRELMGDTRRRARAATQ